MPLPAPLPLPPKKPPAPPIIVIAFSLAIRAAHDVVIQVENLAHQPVIAVPIVSELVVHNPAIPATIALAAAFIPNRSKIAPPSFKTAPGLANSLVKASPNIINVTSIRGGNTMLITLVA